MPADKGRSGRLQPRIQVFGTRSYTTAPLAFRLVLFMFPSLLATQVGHTFPTPTTSRSLLYHMGYRPKHRFVCD